MPRLAPLELGEAAEAAEAAEADEVAEIFAASEKAVGFVTNNLRIMARRPGIAKALLGLFGAVYMEGSVSKELKFLVGYMASFTSGCMYCSAHSAQNSIKQGVDAEKIAAIWDYETSPLFSAAERAALTVAQLAGQVPNAVSDEDFDALKEHFSEAEIVEIVSAISLYGFLNRFNDTVATPLEGPTAEFGGTVLAPAGWKAGKHG